jgi:hypothetical protein
MNDKPSSWERGSVSPGSVGLVFTVLFCVEIAVSPVTLFSVLLGSTLGLIGLAVSFVGIVKGSGRAAGVCGVFAFLLGCLMTFSTVLDMIAHARGHVG